MDTNCMYYNLLVLSVSFIGFVCFVSYILFFLQTFFSNERISYRYVVRHLGQDCELLDIHNSDIESGLTFESVWSS